MDQNRGKDIREAIKRLEKRYRDYFRHKEHKKPQKKKKGRDSPVHSALRKISLGGFLSLINDMY